MDNKNILIYNTEVASYFIWEYTQHSSAIDLWYCAEDISFFLEKNNILSVEDFERLSKSPCFGLLYVGFLREISFRIFMHTRNNDHVFNWYASEKLIFNSEWRNSVIKVANIYRQMRKEKILSFNLIRTNWIKHKLSV